MSLEERKYTNQEDKNNEKIYVGDILISDEYEEFDVEERKGIIGMQSRFSFLELSEWNLSVFKVKREKSSIFD
jgi:hypothetical protein